MTNPADETALPLLNTSASGATTPPRKGISALRTSWQPWLLLTPALLATTIRGTPSRVSGVLEGCRFLRKGYNRILRRRPISSLPRSQLTCAASRHSPSQRWCLSDAVFKSFLLRNTQKRFSVTVDRDHARSCAGTLRPNRPSRYYSASLPPRTQQVRKLPFRPSPLREARLHGRPPISAPLRSFPQ